LLDRQVELVEQVELVMGGVAKMVDPLAVAHEREMYLLHL
jgi:hypothetical protein